MVVDLHAAATSEAISRSYVRRTPEHGVRGKASFVDLDSYANIIAGGDNGPLLVPGDSADLAALLIPELNANHNNGPDDAGFVVTLSQWIDDGALDN